MIVRVRDDDDVVAAVVAADDLGLPDRGPRRWAQRRRPCDGRRRPGGRPARSTRGLGRSGDGDVRVAGGALWEDVDAATWRHHLAVVGGTFGDTGVAGLTLGGGIGWLSGLQGFTCDNLSGRSS